MLVKTCVSCTHFRGEENQLYNPHALRGQPPEPECNHPQAVSRDPIYGKALCRNERSVNKGCGKQGKLWESKLKEKT